MLKQFFEQSGTISDEDLNKSINLVRERAKLPKLSESFVATHNLDMQTEIRRERTVELAWENFRYDDLRRWYIAHIELNKPVRGVVYKNTEWESLENCRS